MCRNVVYMFQSWRCRLVLQFPWQHLLPSCFSWNVVSFIDNVTGCLLLPTDDKISYNLSTARAANKYIRAYINTSTVTVHILFCISVCKPIPLAFINSSLDTRMQAHTHIYLVAFVVGSQMEADQLCIVQDETSEFLKFSESALNKLVRSHLTKSAVRETHWLGLWPQC